MSTVVGEFSMNADVIAHGVLVVDPEGRRWCMLGDRWGFYRHPAGWVHARRNEEGSGHLVTDPMTVAALEAWEVGYLDTGGHRDVTPLRGLRRDLTGMVA